MKPDLAVRRRQAAQRTDFFQSCEVWVIVLQSSTGGRLLRRRSKVGGNLDSQTQGLFYEDAKRFALLARLILRRLQHRIVDIDRCLHARTLAASARKVNVGDAYKPPHTAAGR